MFLAFGCVVALSPLPRGGVFAFIQEFQGYISPGILAAFLVGFIVPKAPPAAGITALAASAPIYGLLQWQAGERAPTCTGCSSRSSLLVATMMAITMAVRPLREPRRLPERAGLDMTSSRAAFVGVVRGHRRRRGVLRSHFR